MLASTIPYVLDNFVMNTNDVTRLYELSGPLIAFWAWCNLSARGMV